MEIEYTLLRGLNERQRQSVELGSGPVMIVAGAGTGKTRVLIHRIAYLILKRGIKPEAVAALTFTNRAAKEMKDRLGQFLESFGIRSMPFCGTFHSFCLSVLGTHYEKAGLDSGFKVFTDREKEAIIKKILQEQEHESGSMVFTVKSVMNSLSSYKNHIFDRIEEGLDKGVKNQTAPRQLTVFQDDDNPLAGKNGKDEIEEPAGADSFNLIFRMYEGELKKRNALDFDDLIGRTIQVFLRNPPVLSGYRKQYTHLLIDEYQDIDRSQYVLARLLAEPMRNICVVGDADQAIYSFRGANVRNFLDFSREYTKAQVIKLEENYRSTPEILCAAGAVVEPNSDRLEKSLRAVKESGERVMIWEVEDDREAAVRIIAEIESLLGGTSMFQHDSQKVASGTSGAQLDFSDFAILYRLNAEASVFEDAFKGAGIPFQLVGRRRFAEHGIIHDVISFLHLALNPHDDLSFRRIINVPRRGLGRKALEIMHEIMVNEGLAYGEVIKIMLSGERRQGSFTSSQMQSLSRFLEQMSSLEEKLSLLTPGALVQEVEKIFALEEFYASRTKLEDAEPGQLLFRLESLASGFEGTAAEFIRAVQLIGSHDLYDPLSDQVTLMTLHASKGLEFDVVFITGVEQELLPLLSNRFEPRNDDAVSFASDGICEEERRLFHVGITRAKSRLYLIYSRNRTLFGRKYSPKPSPFLEDIPPHVCEYKYFSKDKKSIKRIKKQKPPMLF